jgi:pimeloyl-ACP methyl ester carboxylesterase
VSEKSVATVGEQAIAYRVSGSGPCLLLVAGTGYPGGTWCREFVERLEPNFTVVTFDHRGTGASPGSDTAYSTRLFAHDALGLLDALGHEHVHVIGHSMGGRVAQWMAVDGKSRVASLMLASSGAGGLVDVPPDPDDASRHARVAIERMGYREYIADLQRRTFFTPEFLADHSEVADALTESFWENRPSLTDYLKHVAARQQHDARHALSHITQETLVIVGDRDTHQGGTGSHVKQSEQLARSLPHAALHLLPAVGHGYFWQAPKQTADVVNEWLLHGTIDGRPPRPPEQRLATSAGGAP